MPSAQRSVAARQPQPEPVPGAATDRATIDVARARNELPMAMALQAMAAATATSPLRLMREYSSLAFGPGRVSFRDYTNLRLFDDAFYAGHDKRAVVGQRRNRDIAVSVNYRHDWLGLLANKIASVGYLASYGFPTIPCLAIYAENLGIASATLARNRDELGAFLSREDVYPLFGKPAESFQSLGSVGLKAYDARSRSLLKVDGEPIALDAFIDDITTHYAAGYLFQKLMSPHADVIAMSGDRLATVRIVTIVTPDGPKIFRAAWKIPAGGNSADNYWRAGNILAQIDPADGSIRRAMRGTGLELALVTHHPDTGVELAGRRMPGWASLQATTLEGARLMRHVPMIGWDMAAVDSGALIVEMNETPDLFLNQLADGNGALDQELQDFIAFQKKNSAAHFRAVRADVRKM